MKEVVFGSILALVLVAAGCDDDEDYSYRTENCTSVDQGGGQQYELCCRLLCFGEYDYDDFSESCTREYSCASFSGGQCPTDVVDQYGYPHCVY